LFAFGLNPRLGAAAEAEVAPPPPTPN